MKRVILVVGSLVAIAHSAAVQRANEPNPSSTTLAGEQVSHESNILTWEMDKEVIETPSKRSSKENRTLIHQTCLQGENLEKTKEDYERPLKWCATLAKGAANVTEARKHMDRFYEFFGTRDDKIVDTVVANLHAIGDSCGSDNRTSYPTVYCGDVLKEVDGAAVGGCDSPGAITYWAGESKLGKVVSLCDAFEDDVAATWDCWGRTKGGNLLAEFAHDAGISTEHTFYNISLMARLPTEKATNNANSYRWYAQSAVLGCDMPEQWRRDKSTPI